MPWYNQSLQNIPVISTLMGHLAALRALRKTDPGEFWYVCLFWSFWLHLTFFIIGYGFREVLPIICAICLGFYYRYRWHDSVLRRMPLMPLFGCLWGMLLIGVIFSINPWNSFLEVGTAINKGLILPFLGMECVRSCKDLKRLTWGAAIAFLWVGLDGIYQYFHGVDFIMGYPLNADRLTSVMDDYEVGNYLAQVFVPAAGVWYICRQKFSLTVSAILCALLFMPGLFTLYGAAARSSMLALIGSAFAWIICLRGRYWKHFVLVCAIGLVIVAVALQFCTSGRLNIHTIAQDGRWSLWSLAWAVFEDNVFFGAGIDSYNEAFRALGLVPAKDEITISHPHNLYLDILSSTGIVGAALGYTFLFGMLVWQAKKLMPRLVVSWQPPAGTTPQTPGCSRLYWQLTGLFGLGWLTWLVDGIFGHELLRMWWFAHATLGLGVTIGAVIRGIDGERQRDLQS